MNSWSINITPVLCVELKIATKQNLPLKLEGALVLGSFRGKRGSISTK
jgi:hypothetical protein